MSESNKKMFKVLSPIQNRDGGTYWMRCGAGFENRDQSINIIVDALPLSNLAKNEGIKLQLREYTEVELRERAEKRATYQARSTLGPNGLPAMTGSQGSASMASDGVPF